MDFKKIRKFILAGKPLEEIIEAFDWKEFEQIVAEIFISNNFIVKQKFRFKTKRRYEIDIIAVRGQTALCVDCKEWGRGRYKKTSLKYAAKEQEMRTKEFIKFIKNNPIAQTKLKVKPNQKIHPSIVTWLQEELVRENGTFIVPVWKLNSFLLELENYLG